MKQTEGNPASLRRIRRLLEALRKLAGENVGENVGENLAVATPVILCSVNTRFYRRRLLEPFLPKIVVIWHGEIPAPTPAHFFRSRNA